MKAPRINAPLVCLCLLLSGFGSACNQYGTPANKAFARHFEKLQKRYERSEHRNYDYLPYILEGKFEGKDLDIFLADLPVIHLKGTDLYTYVMDPEGNFTLTFSDSLFVKNRLVLEISRTYPPQPDLVVHKKQFKGNKASVSVEVVVPYIGLD